MNENMTAAFIIYAIVAAVCLIVMAVSSAKISSREDTILEKGLRKEVADIIISELRKIPAEEIRHSLMSESEKFMEWQATLMSEENCNLRAQVNELKDLVVKYRSELEKYGYFKLSK